MSYPMRLSLRPDGGAGVGYRVPVKSGGVRVAARTTQKVLELLKQHQSGGVDADRLSAT
jgi:hypothetical protein